MGNRIVAIYARVSTEHEAQLSALENQVQYYDELMKRHPEWELYDRYIDEGITGTSTKKRKNFMRMMKDAEDQKFDLIITREVSRFARNTVDTLQETRKLKKIGVEVWFIEDNIWTLNDEDGELRLTIMATLAQNESKKTSLRVKAGQRVSFENAVPYGNGNILGYNRVNRELVIDEEQAKTVKMIFDMYESGMGVKKIQYSLEKEGRLTSTGKTHWDPGVISRVLRNPFYCGTIVYRKQYVPDYLEQKKINNFGDVEKVVVEGKHTPIVSKEQFANVQSILDSKHVTTKRGKNVGKKPPGDIWTKLIKCQCGANFNKLKWRKYHDGTKQYAYQCYKSKRYGTIQTRIKKGLPIDDICDVKMVPEWKLSLMAKKVFEALFSERENVVDMAYELLSDHIDNEETFRLEKEDTIKKLEKKVEEIEKKLKRVLDLRIEGEIDKDDYIKKKTELEEELTKIKDEISKNATETMNTLDNLDKKLIFLKDFIAKDYDIDFDNIRDDFLEEFVDEIIVEKDKFVWKMGFCREKIDCNIKGTSRNPDILLDLSPNAGEQHRLL